MPNFKHFKPKFSVPKVKFNKFFLVWTIFILLNILFSQSPANSLNSLYISNPATSAFSPHLDIATTWQIALSSMAKSIKNAAFGVGIGNFENVFSSFKTLEFNKRQFWFWNFNSSNSPFLTVLIEQGIVGACFWLSFFYQTYKMHKLYAPHDQDIYYPQKIRWTINLCFAFLTLSALLFAYFPFPFPYFPIFSLSSLLTAQIASFLIFNKNKKSVYIPFIGTSALLTILLLFILQISLINKVNPNLFLYQSSFFLNKAEKEANKKNPNKIEIQQLIIQSLKNSQKAVFLNPKNAKTHYAHLLLLFSLEDKIQNAENLINEEIKTLYQIDPNNPLLFFEIAKHQFEKNDHISALNNFKNAIKLKSDHAKSWFYLYKTYMELAKEAEILGQDEKKEQNIKLAKKAFEETKKLVCEIEKSEKDCQIVQNTKLP